MAQVAVNLDTDPSPAIMAGGIGGGNCSQYWLEDDGKPMMTVSSSKPPYRVPPMEEIGALPWNGFKVASTFSGCGGSCLGYRMAGYRVIWANEFVPVAQQSYRANFPTTMLDPRDIRQIQAMSILEATGLKEGELDLFDGSPPCQAFSTAGKREKGWGKLKTYEHGAKQKNEELFFEYIRLLRGLKPRAFIAENVSGLVKGTAKGFFLEILRELKASGYRVEAKLLDAQWLGVPQTRQRIIFIGVRNDLQRAPAFPKPLPYRYSVRDALAGSCPAGVTGRTGTGYHRRPVDLSAPMNAIMASDPAQTRYEVEDESTDSRTLRAYPDKRGAFGKEGDITEQPAPAVLSGTAGNLWIEGANDVSVVQEQCYREGERVTDGQGPSVTLSGIGAKRRSACSIQENGERRKFTIAELLRICGFPDDFKLIGSYAQQWERLGNSVPPVMMSHIATAVRDHVLAA